MNQNYATIYSRKVTDTKGINAAAEGKAISVFLNRRKANNETLKALKSLENSAAMPIIKHDQKKSMLDLLALIMQNDVKTSFNTAHDAARLVFGESVESLTDNAIYLDELKNSLPASIKSDFNNGLQVLNTEKVNKKCSFKNCQFYGLIAAKCSNDHIIHGFISRTTEEIINKVDSLSVKKSVTLCRMGCNATNEQKYENGCLTDIVGVLAMPTPAAHTKPVLEPSLKLALELNCSRKDALRLQAAFKRLNLDYKAQQTLLKDYQGDLNALYIYLVGMADELDAFSNTMEFDAMGNIKPYIDDAYADVDTLEAYERSENSEQHTSQAFAEYTYYRFDTCEQLHSKDCTNAEPQIMEAFENAASLKELVIKRAAAFSLMRKKAWTAYHERQFDLLCEKFSSKGFKQTLQNCRIDAQYKADTRKKLAYASYGKGKPCQLPSWINEDRLNTLWKVTK